MADNKEKDIFAPPSQEELDMFAPPTESELGEMPVREPASMPEEQAPSISKARALLEGLGQGATLGFAEEITSPAAAIAADPELAKKALLNREINKLDPSAGILSGGVATQTTQTPEMEKFQQLMQQYRDVARAETMKAEQQQPEAFLAGAVGGGMASGALAPAAGAATTMGKIATGAGTGAGVGALTGAGMAEGDLRQRLEQAKEMGIIGGGVGAAIPGAAVAAKTIGRGVKSAAEGIAEIPVVADVIEAAKRGFKGENLLTEAGRRDAGKILRDRSENFINEVKDLQSNVGRQIGDEIEEATMMGETVNLTDEFSTMQSSLKEMLKSSDPEVTRGASRLIKILRKEKKNSLPEEINSQVSELEILARGMREQGEDAAAEQFERQAAKIIDEAPIEMSPDSARKFQNVMFRYSPKGQKPLANEPAGEAMQLSKASRQKLSDTTETLSELNQEFSGIKNALKRMKIDGKRLMDEEAVDKLSRTISQLERETVTGDQAAAMIDDAMNYLRQASPELADKHQAQLTDISRRLELSQKIIKGGETFRLFGTPRAIATGAANAAGLAANKTLMEATPDSLRSMATSIAREGGKVAPKISRVLMKAADATDGKAKNALIFGLMQHPQYRDMLTKHAPSTESLKDVGREE